MRTKAETDQLRKGIQKATQAFLRSGGTIKQLPSETRAHRLYRAGTSAQKGFEL